MTLDRDQRPEVLARVLDGLRELPAQRRAPEPASTAADDAHDDAVPVVLPRRASRTC